MSVIWKFPLRVDDVQEIEMPADAKILTVQMQGPTTPCLWALVDPANPPEQRKILIAGTGHERDDLAMASYVGTFQMVGGQLVFHVFEVSEFAQIVEKAVGQIEEAEKAREAADAPTP